MLIKSWNFSTGVLGFTISDRGSVGKNAPEIVFMSPDKSEHHQLTLMVM
jgi:hypothetical protein